MGEGKLNFAQIAYESYPSWRTKGYNQNLYLYERYLGHRKNESFNLLEIGTAKSYIDYCLWGDYFINANIFYTQIHGVEGFKGKERDLNNDQTRRFEIDDIDDIIKDRSFDVIVDSSGNNFKEVKGLFNKLFPKLILGGYYFIEKIPIPEIMEYACEMGEEAQDAQDFSTMTNENRMGLKNDYGLVVFEKKNNIERALENVLGK